LKKFAEISPQICAEHEYSVSRGVRPLAEVGQCSANKTAMLRAITKLGMVTSGTAIPFILKRDGGIADYAYASHRWIIDLYKWAIKQTGSITKNQRSQIIGLLLGFRPDATENLEHWTGDLKPDQLTHLSGRNCLRYLGLGLY
jgi:hypothetical protein